VPVYSLRDQAPSLAEDVWVAPGARVAGRVSLGRGVSVWFNAVIRGDLAPIRVGEETNLQDGVVLHVDIDTPLLIGRRCIVGHGAILHGCTLEDDVLVGMGAVILNRARIGRGSLVAAGALVREGAVIPPFSLVAGLPATIKRRLPEEETLRELHRNVARYREAARNYALHSREEKP